MKRLVGLVAGVALFGASALFGYLASVLLALAAFVAVRMLARSEVPRGLRGAFVPAAAAPPRHAELASRILTVLRHPRSSNR